MLQGARVKLRAMDPDDVPTLWEYWGDVDVAMRASNRPPKPFTLEETRKVFGDLAERDDLVRFVIDAGGDVVGDCMLHSIDKHNRCCEIGIALGKPHWGKGYGQEAVSLLVAFAFEHHNMHRVGLEVLADDERAVGCYRKAGYVEEGRFRSRDWVEGAYHDVMVMGILEEEWSGR